MWGVGLWGFRENGAQRYAGMPEISVGKTQVRFSGLDFGGSEVGVGMRKAAQG